MTSKSHRCWARIAIAAAASWQMVMVAAAQYEHPIESLRNVKTVVDSNQAVVPVAASLPMAQDVEQPLKLLDPVAPPGNSPSVVSANGYAPGEHARNEFSPNELSDAQLPPTLNDFQQQTIRELQIDEAVLLALDNNKYLRAIGFRTPLWQTRIDEAAAIFDPLVAASGRYQDSTSRLTSQITAAGTGASSQDSQTFDPLPKIGDTLSWSKRLRNGAKLQFSYDAEYEQIDPAGDFRLVNPAWRSGISAGIEQPLLRGAGLVANHAKIEIAGQFYHRAAADIQHAMNYLARSVRRAYWNLGYAVRIQEILEKASRRATETYENEEKRFRIGASDRAKVAQARELMERFRILELDSRQDIVEKERVLRHHIGIDGFDCQRFAVSGDVVEDAFLDWDQAVALAMETRPDIAAQQAHIRAYQHEIDLRRNERLPDVSVIGRATLGGLDGDLSGSIEDTFSGDNPGYMVGMLYRRQVNNQLGNAMLRRAQLHVAQQEAYLNQLVFDITHEMQRAYQTLVTFRERRRMQYSRLEAANERLAASERQFRARKVGNLDYLLRAQEAQTDAELSLARALADYRKAVEEWDYQRGAILSRNAATSQCDSLAEQIVP